MSLITSKIALNRAISEEKGKLTNKDVFTSNVFTAILENILKGIGKIYGIAKFKLSVEWKKPSDYVAYATEDCAFALNANNQIVKYAKTRAEKYACLIGIICHEVSHRLWTNYKETNYVVSLIASGCVDFETSKHIDAYLKKYPTQSHYVQKLFMAIANCIEDGFIEKMFLLTYHGYAKYLKTARNMQMQDCVPLSKQRADGISTVCIIQNVILDYSKYGILPDAETDEASDAFYFVKPYIDDALDEMDSKDRIRKYVEVLDELLFWLEKKEEEKKESENSKSGSSSGGESKEESSESGSSSGGESKEESSESGSSSGGESKEESSESGSSSDIEDTLKEMAESISDRLKSECESMPDYSPLSDKKGKLSEKETSASASTDDTDALSSDLSRLEKDVAEEKVGKEQEKELAREAQKLSSEVPLDKDYYCGYDTYEIKRIDDATPSGDFVELSKRTDATLRKLVREFERKIKDAQLGDKQGGLYSGKRVKQPYRTDLRRFEDKKLPQNIPDMTLCLLVDMSGSMRDGVRDYYARETAILIYKFCQRIGIPCIVYGHSADIGSADTTIYTFADSNSLDKKDIYRISNLMNYVHGNNRDGHAIRYCCERLLNETSEQKLMMIISDGSPASRGYSGIYGAPKADIDDILRSYGRKGIKFITAGIGDDTEAIKHLYTYGLSDKVSARFLEISDTQKMPKILVEYLKKIIMP